MVSSGGLFVACRDAAEPFELGDAPLDQISPLVGFAIVFDWRRTSKYLDQLRAM
jgi:hypothetical protein